MTNTVIAVTKAKPKFGAGPKISQIKNVKIEMTTTVGTNTLEILSANLAMAGLAFCACLTLKII